MPDDLERIEPVEYVLGLAEELCELFIRECEEIGAVNVRASIPGATSMLQAEGRPSTRKKWICALSTLAQIVLMGSCVVGKRRI